MSARKDRMALACSTLDTDPAGVWDLVKECENRWPKFQRDYAIYADLLNGCTQSEAGAKFGVSQHRIAEIEARARRRMYRVKRERDREA